MIHLIRVIKWLRCCSSACCVNLEVIKENKVSTWHITTCLSTSVDRSLYLLPPLHKNRTVSFIFVRWEGFWCNVEDVYLKNSVVISPETETPLIRWSWSLSDGTKWWVSQHELRMMQHLCQLLLLSGLLWSACQAAACVWGGISTRISRTWHISVTCYLAVVRALLTHKQIFTPKLAHIGDWLLSQWTSLCLFSGVSRSTSRTRQKTGNIRKQQRVPWQCSGGYFSL